MSETEAIASAPGDSLENEGRVFPFGLFAYIGAGASMLVCYGKTILVAIFGSLGIQVVYLNPHLQAVLMWVLGMVAVYGLYRDRSVHRKNYPLVIGICGVLVIIGTLYTYYESAIEVSGYILLLSAAFLNQNLFLLHLNQQVRQQARDLERLNSSLEERVSDQVSEIERLNRLKRFLASEVAALVTTEQEKSLLQSHRAFIATLFCDLRGFTSFSVNMEPEEVMDVLQRYHQQLGRLAAEHKGTIDHLAGDGLMVYFNDPLPCDDPVYRAIELAMAMQAMFTELNQEWLRKGYDLGFGVGIASGYATLGVVGFEGRHDYTAIGNAVNLAARLCDEARDGQILISHQTYAEVENRVEVSPIGELELKGIHKPVTAYNVAGFIDHDSSTR